MRTDRVAFPNLNPSNFTHPADEAALAAVRNLPLINTVLKKMMQYGYEKILRVRAMSDAVKATPRSYGALHEMLADIADRLALPTPDLFVEQHPIPQAWTTGAEYPFIVIQSGAIDLLTDDEVYAVLAHEVGHVKCGHVLYLTAARFLTSMAASLGVVGLPLQGLILALLEWSRKAEFTADRASLLCVQDSSTVQHVLMKLAGGSTRLAAQIDPQEFQRQGQMYSALTAGVSLNKFYAVMQMLPLTHPYPVVRADEIKSWSESEDYRRLLAGEYPRFVPPTRTPVTECPHCSAPQTDGANHCARCGNMVVSVGDTLVSAADTYLSGAFRSAANTMSRAWDEVRGMFDEHERPASPDAPVWPGEEAEDKPRPPGERLYCIRCGVQNDVDARFCKACGAAMPKL